MAKLSIAIILAAAAIAPIVAEPVQEADGLFERAESEEGASTARTSHRHRNRVTRFGPIFSSPTSPSFGHGPVVPFRGNPGLRFGHGPVVNGGYKGLRPQPVPARVGGLLRPASRGLGPREFDESEDMFEREFEDTEFDARDFEDELDGLVERAESEEGASSPRPLRMGRRIPISPMLRFGHGPVIPPTFKGIRPLHNGFTGILPPRPRIRVGGVMRRGSASRGLGPREFDESEDMFEREFEDTEFDARDFEDEFDGLVERAESEEGASSPSPLRMGRPSRSPTRLHFGHGPVMNGGYKGLHPQRPRMRVGGVNRRGSASRGLGPREFDESDDIFEREFEDTEFNARDFDDELYLD